MYEDVAKDGVAVASRLSKLDACVGRRGPRAAKGFGGALNLGRAPACFRSRHAVSIEIAPRIEAPAAGAAVGVGTGSAASLARRRDASCTTATATANRTERDRTSPDFERTPQDLVTIVSPREAMENRRQPA